MVERLPPERLEISIHSLLAEGDKGSAFINGYRYEFQSTPSSRRETLHAAARAPRRAYFNPLPPRGGRRTALTERRAELQFQSTPSSRRETMLHVGDVVQVAISIHSLLAEGDQRHL